MSLENKYLEEMCCMSKEDQREWARNNFWPPDSTIYPKWPSEVQNECLKMIAEHHMCSCGRDDKREQYSFGIYAGKMCDECAYEKYADHCGLGLEGQGDQNELRMMGETIEAEGY